MLRDAANFLVELTRDLKPIVFVTSIVGDECREPIADRIEVFSDTVAKWAAGETIRKVKTDERSMVFNQMARKSFVQLLGSFSSGGDVGCLIQYKIVFLTMRRNFVLGPGSLGNPDTILSPFGPVVCAPVDEQIGIEESSGCRG